MSAARVVLPEPCTVTNLNRSARWADIVDESDDELLEQADREKLRSNSQFGIPVMPPATPLELAAMLRSTPPATWPATHRQKGVPAVILRDNGHGNVVPACGQWARKVSPSLDCKTRDAGMKASQQEELQTTVCFRNLPNNYSTEMVRELLDTNGLNDTYDFVYVPHNITRLPSLAALGYFYVNFDSHDHALSAWEYLSGFKDWAVDSHKVLAATWATKTFVRSFVTPQGQTCPVMHQNIPAECKPVFIKKGEVPMSSAQTKLHLPLCHSRCSSNSTHVPSDVSDEDTVTDCA